MVLGDNIFFGHGLPEILPAPMRRTLAARCSAIMSPIPNAMAWPFRRRWPGHPIIEKPEVPRSNFAITGLYFLDGRAPIWPPGSSPRPRGELEIVDLLEHYRAEGSLQVERMGRGFAWLDTGTPGSLLDAGNFVRTWKSGRACRSAHPTRSPIAKAGSTAPGLPTGRRLFAKSSYGHASVAGSDPARSGRLGIGPDFRQGVLGWELELTVPERPRSNPL
jgi:glucose-1-phosphate thymidylyltransferase